MNNAFRRELLAGITTATAGLCAGCSGPILCEKPSDAATQPIEPARGESVRLSKDAERDVQPERYQYVESNDTVRYAASTSGGEIEAYDTMTWEEFSRIKTTGIVVEYLSDVISSETGDEDHNARPHVEYGENPFPVIVSLETRTQNGCVIDRPSNSPETIREVVPSKMTVEVVLEGKSERASLAVGVEKTVRELANPA